MMYYLCIWVHVFVLVHNEINQKVSELEYRVSASESNIEKCKV